jgi:hypothetical protein
MLLDLGPYFEKQSAVQIKASCPFGPLKISSRSTEIKISSQFYLSSSDMLTKAFESIKGLGVGQMGTC